VGSKVGDVVGEDEGLVDGFGVGCSKTYVGVRVGDTVGAMDGEEVGAMGC